MKIINKTTGSVITRDAFFANTFWQKTKGLIGEPPSKTLVLRTRFGIHTFGMRRPIAVVVLDKNNIVRKIKKNLVPNRIFIWNPRFSSVIETAKNIKIKCCDKLMFISS